jgi:hypothetical protein
LCSSFLLLSLPWAAGWRGGGYLAVQRKQKKGQQKQKRAALSANTQRRKEKREWNKNHINL